MQTPHPVVTLCPLHSQTQKLVEDGDIEAARREFLTSFWCRLIAWIWATIVGSFATTAIIVVGVVYGAASNRE